MKLDAFVLFCSVLMLSATFKIAWSEQNNVAPSSVAHLVDPFNYDKWRRPNQNQTTLVYVHMHVYSIGSLDTQNLEYTIQILFRCRWTDPRLQQSEFLRLEEGLWVDKIWSPHLYFVNEKHSKVMGSLHKDLTMSIWPDGTVVQLSRVMVTARCALDLQKFPFDSQRCPLLIESWRYNSSQMELRWEPNSPVSVEKQLQLPEYSLINITTNSSVTRNYQQTSSSVDDHIVLYGKEAKNFSTLTLYISVQRQYGFYIMDYYLPSILIVAVSWVTFWLDPNSVPGRTVLGSSTLLTFITLSRNIGSSLPKVSYVKSSEIWFIGCTVFIFGALAEFAFVNIIWRRKKNVDLKKVTGKHILQSTVTPQMYRKQLNQFRYTPSVSSLGSSQTGSLTNNISKSQLTLSLGSVSSDPLPVLKSTLEGKQTSNGHSEEADHTAKSLFTMTPQEIANWIDRRSRLLFPVAFLILNFLYWTWTLVLF